MTKIRLGTGADAVDVVDGDAVPLVDGRRAHIRRIWGDEVCVKYAHEGVVHVITINPASGIFHPIPAGHCTGVDLAALRRERAPRVVIIDGWTNGLFEGPTIRNLYASTVLNLFQRADSALGKHYWTHRPGNTPDLQAAFDAAVDAYVQAVSSSADTYKPANALVAAARALGYGSKP